MLNQEHFDVSLEHFQEGQRHYRNAGKLDSSSLKPMTGLLMAQLMEYEFENQGDSSLNPSTKSITSARDKIYREIENLEELNRATGPNEVRVGFPSLPPSLLSLLSPNFT